MKRSIENYTIIYIRYNYSDTLGDNYPDTLRDNYFDTLRDNYFDTLRDNHWNTSTCDSSDTFRENLLWYN